MSLRTLDLDALDRASWGVPDEEDEDTVEVLYDLYDIDEQYTRTHTGTGTRTGTRTPTLESLIRREEELRRMRSRRLEDYWMAVARGQEEALPGRDETCGRVEASHGQS